MNAIDEIKKAMGSKKLIIGENSTKRALKSKEAEMVMVAKNAPKILTKELEKLCEIGKIKFEKMDKDNTELGLTCRKPFAVSVLSIKK